VGVRTGPTEVFTVPTHTNIFFDLKPGLRISQDDYIAMDTATPAGGSATTMRPIVGSFMDHFTSPLSDGGPPPGQLGGSDLNQEVYLQATVEPDADGDGFGDETQDKCPTVAAPTDGCPPVTLPPPATGQRAAALKKCRAKFKKNHRRGAFKKCKKKANRLPV
jgi:hypothetical protein